MLCLELWGWFVCRFLKASINYILKVRWQRVVVMKMPGPMVGCLVCCPAVVSCQWRTWRQWYIPGGRLGSLLLIWNIWIKFLVPCFRLAWSSPACMHLRSEQIDGNTLYWCLSPCLSNKFKKWKWHDKVVPNVLIRCLNCVQNIHMPACIHKVCGHRFNQPWIENILENVVYCTEPVDFPCHCFLNNIV